MSMIKQMRDLEPGFCYIPVFERTESIDEFGNINDHYRLDSPYYTYLGGGEFDDEYGQPVAGFFDPELQMMVATDATDGFVQ